MKCILGTKEGMTQVFDENGVARAATVLRVLPTVISQVKRMDTDGYEAVQIASGDQKEHRSSKAQTGHVGATKKHIREFRVRQNRGESLGDVQKGMEFDASVFESGDVVSVCAISKGKGFQGVVKRHGFAGDKASHGRKHSARTPGSIGGGGRAGGRVIKGMRMAGRMGGERVTVKNLRILQSNKETNLLVVSGAVPGRRGTVVEIRKTARD